MFDGPINGEAFRAYVEQIILPTLEAGDIVILDNLGSHKGRAKRAKTWFLPAHSPDLNPIEQAIAKMQHFLRKTWQRNWYRVGHVLGAIKPGGCAT